MEFKYHIRDILKAYRKGLFPMAEDAKAEQFFFYEPELRGLLPIHDFHIPKSLRKTARKKPYKVSVDQSFSAVIDSCAQSTARRPKTWINKHIRDLFVMLHQAGYAHSVECRSRDGALVGGLYGLALGGAFFGESMFSRADDASKIALIYLMARLWACGFQICDTQFLNAHLQQFGAYEIPQSEYVQMLNKALDIPAQFNDPKIADIYQDEDELFNAYVGYCNG